MKNYQIARILHDSCPKNYQNIRIFMIFAGKINKIHQFNMIFARKMPEFYIKIAPKNLFSRILGGTCPPAPRLLRLCFFVNLRFERCNNRGQQSPAREFRPSGLRRLVSFNIKFGPENVPNDERLFSC